MKLFLLTFLWAVCLVHSSPNARIIGGQQARAGQFPFQASIVHQTAVGSYFCSGALVAPFYILTAAQCVQNATKFTISLGANTLNDNDINRVTLTAEYYVVNPNFNMSTLEHDIALILLNEPVLYSDYIKPASVPTNEIAAGQSVIAVGWGQTDDMTPGPVNHLYYTNVVTMANAECKITYGDQLFDTMLCAEGNFNEGTCIGDMGGPLVRYVLNSRFIEVVGVASFLSINGCESTDPSGYTRVAPYYDWITSVIQQNPTTIGSQV